MKANIFNIQKFSIHDGPGIRTVVFFKGCPLNCLWCSNPESQVAVSQLLWDSTKCLHCELCSRKCPSGCISFQNNSLQFQKESCTGCLNCISQCPGKALKLSGKFMSIEEVITELLKDKDFYEESHGGITLSGGEVLSQPDFAAALLEECQVLNLHTAIETTGYAPAETFKKVVQYTNLLLYDMKHYDNQKHLRYTGVSNVQIIENMLWAVSVGIPIVARIPVIPGINDSSEDADQFCKLLKTIGITTVNLLPFHQFGQKKYEQLNRLYKLQDVPALHSEDLKEFFQIFQKNDFQVTM